MANFTDYYERKLLDATLGVTPYTFPTTVYLALFSANPTDTGSVTNELSGGNYNRVALTAKFTAASGTTGVSSNTAQIIFPTANADWLAASYIGIMESGTPGADDMLIWGALAGSVTVLNTEVFTILIGNLSLTLA